MRSKFGYTHFESIVTKQPNFKRLPCRSAPVIWRKFSEHTSPRQAAGKWIQKDSITSKLMTDADLETFDGFPIDIIRVAEIRLDAPR